MPREKLKPTDGLGPHEIKKIRSAIRLVWQRSLARRLCIKRCTTESGFLRCEKCGVTTPKILVDHITACGDVDGGFLERLFCPSSQLQGLCKSCHAAKTKEERATKSLQTQSKQREPQTE